jgi:hypothetical protein
VWICLWYGQTGKVLQGVPPRRRCRSVFASESPSATKGRKAKQYTLGTSGNDRQDDDQKEGLS